MRLVSKEPSICPPGRTEEPTPDHDARFSVSAGAALAVAQILFLGYSGQLV